ncbi:hypothetical protein VNO78_19037 [Psophocarpus tetragonolobus]|uniref:Uncharacterized protein n=1 Tax=Psophocarpus tetragonolobus TaxID=3891 RepID=A0AAN9XFN1_PSOTE
MELISFQHNELVFLRLEFSSHVMPWSQSGLNSTFVAQARRRTSTSLSRAPSRVKSHTVLLFSPLLTTLAVKGRSGDAKTHASRFARGRHPSS